MEGRAMATTTATSELEASSGFTLADLRRPPPGLFARMRWGLLLVSLVLAAVIAVAGGGAAGGLAPVAVLAPIGLAALWLYVYGRGDYPVWVDLLVGLAVLGIAVAVPAPRLVQLGLAAATWMRALYGD